MTDRGHYRPAARWRTRPFRTKVSSDTHGEGPRWKRKPLGNITALPKVVSPLRPNEKKKNHDGAGRRERPGGRATKIHFLPHVPKTSRRCRFAPITERPSECAAPCPREGVRGRSLPSALLRPRCPVCPTPHVRSQRDDTVASRASYARSSPWARRLSPLAGLGAPRFRPPSRLVLSSEPPIQCFRGTGHPSPPARTPLLAVAPGLSFDTTPGLAPLRQPK